MTGPTNDAYRCQRLVKALTETRRGTPIEAILDPERGFSIIG